ncbi:hypothetical protein C475_17838 [Halosimplex carlsbadense 2-9-1]|uniref:Uncharacterized protein n=1 Tax=Halosimplex carlsbadense 2-9-1 TaxID=797114 RepID=M0CID2_9EURY|nr:hypothetical protein [Halosimplex carlsbadense]ELZ22398.1 hypothetical protein C475_17838 [Halosimplex carlsbadense 2-9-1]
MPQTVPVGERVDGLSPPGRWVNAVDVTRLYTQENRPTRGGETSVEVRLTNRTTEPLAVREPVTVNGDEVAVLTQALDPEETTTTDVTVPVPKGADAITISVADASDTSNTSGYLTGSNLSISPDPPMRNRMATVSVQWTNTLSEPITEDLPLTVNGQRLGTRPLSLGPNGSERMEAEVPVGSGSRLDVELGSASVSVNTTTDDSDDPTPDPEPEPTPDPEPDPNPGSGGSLPLVGALADMLTERFGVSRNMAFGALAIGALALGGVVLG